MMKASANKALNDDERYALRAARDIPQPEEIVALRKSYGLTQREFADLIGIGVASLQRYEKGSLASDSHARLLKLARNPRFMFSCLEDPLTQLSERARQRVRHHVEALLGSRIEYEVVRLDLLEGMDCGARSESGMHSLDADRLRETVVYLAWHDDALFRTKLDKLLFYLDFLAHRDSGTGFTGLRYVKTDAGSAPYQYELLVASLVDEKSLALQVQADAQVIVALRPPSEEAFSCEDLLLLGQVLRFAKGFANSEELARHSRCERAWCEAEVGDFLDYDLARYIELPSEGE